MLHCVFLAFVSLHGRRSKGKGKGIRARDNARGSFDQSGF